MPLMHKFNYPVETEEAQKFWASNHKCNRMKATIAFSFDLSNANTNLKRAGYSFLWRQKALYNFAQYVNQPDMQNIPLTPMETPWWECMPFDENG